MGHHKETQVWHNRMENKEKRGPESRFKETMAENFLNLGIDANIHLKEAELPIKFNPKKSSPRH